MKNCLFSIALLLLTVSLALAQRTITGSVVDDKTNEALPGANILIVGTNSGTTADAKGAFSITVPATASALQVSFIGYTNQEILIGNQTNVAVRLASGGQLAEVVVLGYTTARRQDLTGAVAIIEPAVTKATSSGNPLQALQGRTQGCISRKPAPRRARPAAS